MIPIGERPVGREAFSHGLEVVVDYDENSELFKAAQEVTAVRFVQEGYYDSLEEVDAEYRPYDRHSLFVAAIQGGEIIAAARLIIPNSEVGQIAVNDLLDPNCPLNADDKGWQDIAAAGRDKLLDIATIATPLHDESDVSIADRSLYCLGGVLAVAKLAKLTHLIAGLDVRGYYLYRMKYGDPIWTIGEKVNYHKSPCVPIMADVEAALNNGSDEVRQATQIGYRAVTSVFK